MELVDDKGMHEECLLGALKQRIRDVQQGPEGMLYVLTDEVNGKLMKPMYVPIVRHVSYV